MCRKNKKLHYKSKRKRPKIGEEDSKKLYKKFWNQKQQIDQSRIKDRKIKWKVTSKESELNLLRNIISLLNVEVERLSKSGEDLLIMEVGEKSTLGYKLIAYTRPGSSFRISEKPQQQ
ncbi:unnamed protein product (macronuclear) [Paramecium tetraurelia]|uniref:Uncharacterized protein n=1 Tax=Paramecium tetraurelia TaxID=5888 RepID=A0CB29_PARTE|nr:uncharacterized protein GSPATT00036779001 [Paramecium tetraurelia]CAK67996.1 unnamed protein product [Paramecium tetraurelia]|eukprot:XP_001435393.1 hypothetical protein (macronuclear) [Paramecium tetraurelia strain d4-2]